MKDERTKTLLIGIGNSGRADDGLGWAFLDQLAHRLPPEWKCEYRYQLQVDDAELISRFDRVCFIDADQRLHAAGYMFDQIQAIPTHSLTSHQLDPATVLSLCEEIYHQSPKAYLLGISGIDFRLALGLSRAAEKHLEEALEFFVQKVIEEPQKVDA